MKHNVILLLCLVLGLFSCYDDKGNYDYREIDELTITGIPEELMSALYKSENLVLSPAVTSKFDGVINADDPNYEFSYYYDRPVGGDFLEPRLLDSSRVKDLNILAEIDPGNYTVWFKVKDLRTNIVTSAEFKLSVVTSTTKGWVVLCEEGSERKVRIDMIGEVGDRIAVSRNLLDFLPESHGACQILLESNMLYTANSPYLNLYTEDNSFCIWSYNGNFNRNFNDPRSTVFARPIDDFIVREENNYSYIVITADGDVYQKMSSSSALYDVKINVDEPFGEPNYKMAPFIGVGWSNGYNGILYDKTNRRFKYFLQYAVIPNGTKYLFDPKEPETGSKLFDWNTGKDMVYMAGTRQGGGNLVFALLKDAAGQYSIYGITAGQYQDSPVQSTYMDIDAAKAPGLANATCFAFHPTLPFLIYNSGNEVYLYDMSTRSARRVLILPGENSVSMLKFNKLPRLGLGHSIHYPDVAIDCQYRLAVGSVNSDAEAGSEGILRFYDVPEFAGDLTQFGETYTGFGIVKDIAYKAR